MTLGDFFRKAQDVGFALGAFNAGDLSMIKGIVQAAERLHSPVIIETSPGETSFLGMENLVDIISNFKEDKSLPIFLNLDHANSLESLEEGIREGYDLVHFDGSSLAYEQNVDYTKKIVSWAHPQGVLVEAEIDKITGESKLHEDEAQKTQSAGVYTDADRAYEFVEKTGIDVFAAFVGNIHGVYQDPIRLDRERLRSVREKVPCFLSLHGGSGISKEEIEFAIKEGGVVKVNVSTELRLAYKTALESEVKTSVEAAPYKLMMPVVEAVQKLVEEKMQMFGSVGRV